MLEYLDGKVSNRKFRWYATTCCRRFWHLLDDKHGRFAIETAERCAEGLISVDDLWEIGQKEELGFNYDLHENVAQLLGVDRAIIASAFYAVGLTMGAMGWVQARNAVSAAARTAGAIGLGSKADEYSYDEQEEYEQAAMPFTSVERVAQVVLLHEVFGNPFRPVVVDLSWLTSTVVLIAQGIYADRDFSPMPILADALQDAGCDNANVLDHCRGSGPHVRGCWVVDMLLGKS